MFQTCVLLPGSTLLLALSLLAWLEVPHRVPLQHNSQLAQQDDKGNTDVKTTFLMTLMAKFCLSHGSAKMRCTVVHYIVEHQVSVCSGVANSYALTP